LTAVDNVSFEIRPGETLGVVGESGCGKSTLGRAVLQLIPPTDGQVVWMGENLGSLPKGKMRELRQDMQIIFQDPLASLDPRMTVGDIIGEPLATFFPKMAKAERRAKVQDIMTHVGLMAEMVNRFPHEFSGSPAARPSASASPGP
jgi:oligopeptide transport system ATP-binding protein